MSIPADDEFWMRRSPIRTASPCSSIRCTTAAQPRCTPCGSRRRHAFYTGAQLWLARFGDGTASTADFESVFEEASGQDLTAFFQVWVHDPVKPTSCDLP